MPNKQACRRLAWKPDKALLTPTSSTKGVVCDAPTNTELVGLVGPECQSLVPEDGPADEDTTTSSISRPASTDPPASRGHPTDR
jgi:hypothetical protein